MDHGKRQGKSFRGVKLLFRKEYALVFYGKVHYFLKREMVRRNCANKGREDANWRRDVNNHRARKSTLRIKKRKRKNKRIPECGLACRGGEREDWGGKHTEIGKEMKLSLFVY